MESDAKEPSVNQILLATDQGSWFWFLFITFALGIAWKFAFDAIDIFEINLNWAKYRCNPAVMPFAGMYGHDVTENFNQCLNGLFRLQIPGITNPFTSIMSVIMANVMKFMENINSLRLMLATLMGGISKIIQEFIDRFKLLFSQVRLTTLRMQLLFKRVFATFQALIYMGTSGVTAGLNFGDTFIFKFIDTFCFPPETKIQIQGRGLIPISEVRLGDICEVNGARVTSTQRFLADGQPMVWLKGVEVSTNHFVRHEGKWIPASHHPEAHPIGWWNGGTKRPLICLDTDKHEIPLKDLIFSDWDETSESDEKTMILAEEKLNGAPTEVPRCPRPWLQQPAVDSQTLIRMKDGSLKCADQVREGEFISTGQVSGTGRRLVTKSLVLSTGERVTPSTLIWKNTSWQRAGLLEPELIEEHEPIVFTTLVVITTAAFETEKGTWVRDMCEVQSPEMEEPTAKSLDSIRVIG